MIVRAIRAMRPSAAAGAAALSWVLWATAARAGVTLTPTLKMEGKWDSNIFNSSTGEISDYYLRAMPGVVLSLDAFNTTLGVTAGLEIYRYASRKELDSSRINRNFNLSTAQPLRITPRFQLLPAARFLQTDDAVRRNQLMESPVPGLPPSEAVVTARNQERNYMASLSATYLISPQVEMSAMGGWTKRDFLDASLGSPLVSSTSFLEGISLASRPSPRFSWGLFSNASQDRYETRPDSETYAGGVSVMYLPAEKFSVDAKVGASYAHQSADNNTPAVDDWGPYGNLSASRTWEKWKAGLSVFAGYAGGGSFGTPQYRFNTALSLSYQIAEGWLWDTGGYYQWNQPTNEQKDRRVTTAEVKTGLRYRLTEWASLSLGGEATVQRSSAAVGADIERYSAILGVNLGYPIKLL